MGAVRIYRRLLLVSKHLGSLAAIALFLATGCVAPSEETGSSATGPAAPSVNPIVGGATMYPNRTIAQNAGSSRDHTTLVRAVQAAGLTDKLGSAGPYTLFAPTNAAFDKLPTGTVSTLLEPVNRGLLARVLDYHVIPGRKTRTQIAADIRSGGGAATYTSAAGGTLRARMEGSVLVITDVKGGRSRVTQADVTQANGVMHVVDTVLIPAI
jgi:uncharacterized surface protein with fasciclin (FAS1) repeats